MYHEVAPHPPSGFRKYVVTPAEFARQMRLLSYLGYRSITFDTLLAARAGGARLPARPVIITFDDGFRDCADYAAEALARYGQSATFYLVAGLMGDSSRWLLAEVGLELPLMSWDTARRLEQNGHRCGSHALTHPKLASLSPTACREQLTRSRHLLEDRLGREVRDLAYPFGSHSPVVRNLAEEAGYRSGCGVQIGIARHQDHVLALPRVPINGGESLADFACRLATAHRLSEIAWAGAGRLRRLLSRRSGGGWRRQPSS
jgi:peptidoglycan/xylan/chitin deacetylase (PgdA/CDA1 family)